MTRLCHLHTVYNIQVRVNSIWGRERAFHPSHAEKWPGSELVQSPHLKTRRVCACRQLFYKAKGSIDLTGGAGVWSLHYTNCTKSVEISSSWPGTNSATKQSKHYSLWLCNYTLPPSPPPTTQVVCSISGTKKWRESTRTVCRVERGRAVCPRGLLANGRFLDSCVCVCMGWYSVLQFQPPTAVCLHVVKPEIRFDQFEHVITLLSSI